ncbi:hypothetical protein DYB37_002364 [Aphanomyces astaci]|uniref:Fanconi anemia group M protein n=1 Tax=Aphanomyces astaci TaxID=112090 RepID=A0A418EKB3_APHAT|nr:hypothetical protein DYB37_002364 [Aphanomyces astaci]
MEIPEESVVMGADIDRDLATQWIYPSNYPVRAYQQSISRAALLQNTLVCLPTGLGKTLIAAVVMFNFYRWFPRGKIVFMAPTKPLVSQQIQACHDVMPIPQSDMAELQGNVAPAKRKQLWATKRVFFCTPQSLQNDIERGNCDVRSFVCVVVDEAHRATGNYAYVVVIKAIAAKVSGFRVLALSATPGAKFDVIQDVITNLRISHIECKNGDDPDVRPKKMVLESPEFAHLLALVQAQVGGGRTASNNPKLMQLQVVLSEHFTRHERGGSSTRSIVFTQYRESVTEIVALLSSMAPLIKVQQFIGQGTAKGKDGKGQTQKQQQQVVAKFRDGEFNVLVATCIAEEGLDIGEVDLIVSFDCLTSPVRMIQRMGRTGRKRVGRVVLLVTEGDEEKKLERSVSAAKSVNRSLTIFKDKFKCVPSARMIPTGIVPQLTESAMIVPMFQASLIGGKKGGGGGARPSTTAAPDWHLTDDEVYRPHNAILRLKHDLPGQYTRRSHLFTSLMVPLRLSDMSKPHHFGKSTRSRCLLQLMHRVHEGDRMTNAEFQHRFHHAVAAQKEETGGQNWHEEGHYNADNVKEDDNMSCMSSPLSFDDGVALSFDDSVPHDGFRSPNLSNDNQQHVIDITSSPESTAASPTTLKQADVDSLSVASDKDRKVVKQMQPTPRVFSLFSRPGGSSPKPDKHYRVASTSSPAKPIKISKSPPAKTPTPAVVACSLMSSSLKRKSPTTSMSLDTSVGVMQQGEQVIAMLERLAAQEVASPEGKQGGSQLTPKSPTLSPQHPPVVLPPRKPLPRLFDAPSVRPPPRTRDDVVPEAPRKSQQTVAAASSFDMSSGIPAADMPPTPTMDEVFGSNGLRTAPTNDLKKSLQFASSCSHVHYDYAMPTMADDGVHNAAQPHVPCPPIASRKDGHASTTKSKPTLSSTVDMTVQTSFDRAPPSEVKMTSASARPRSNLTANSSVPTKDAAMANGKRKRSIGPLATHTGDRLNMIPTPPSREAIPHTPSHVKKAAVGGEGAAFGEDDEFVMEPTPPRTNQLPPSTTTTQSYNPPDTPLQDNCQVCGDDESSETDPILYCDGCNVAVHQHCYGVRVIPPHDWFCDACQDKSKPTKCVLCPERKGALKKTKCQQWVHSGSVYMSQTTPGSDPRPRKQRKRLRAGDSKTSTRRRLDQSPSNRHKTKKRKASKQLISHYIEMQADDDEDDGSDEEDEKDDEHGLHSSFIDDASPSSTQFLSPSSMQAIYRRRDSTSPALAVSRFLPRDGIVAACLQRHDEGIHDVMDTSVVDDEGLLHHGISCDECQLHPIEGVRYNCQRCPQYNLCMCCYSAREDFHPQSHVFTPFEACQAGPSPPGRVVVAVAAAAPPPPQSPGLTRAPCPTHENRVVHGPPDDVRGAKAPQVPAPKQPSVQQPMAAADLTADQIARMEESRKKALERTRRRLDENRRQQLQQLQPVGGRPSASEGAPPPSIPLLPNFSLMVEPTTTTRRPTPTLPPSVTVSPAETTPEMPSFNLLPSLNVMATPPRVGFSIAYHPRVRSSALLLAVFGHDPLPKVPEPSLECDLLLSARRALLVIQEAKQGHGLVQYEHNRGKDPHFLDRWQLFHAVPHLSFGGQQALATRFPNLPVTTLLQMNTRFNPMHWKRMLPWISDTAAQSIHSHLKSKL